ncbi:MAG: TlpA disulfide reductase family protein [Bacteroidota bacterium]
MRYILLAFLSIAVSTYAQEKNEQIIIKGTIKGDNKGFNKVYCYGEGIPKGLVHEMKDGNFEFTIPFYKPVFPRFFTEYDSKVKKRYLPFGVLIDKPGVVIITVGNIDKGFNSSIVTGLQSAALYQTFNNDKEKIDEQTLELVKKQYGKDSILNEDSAFGKIDKSRDSLINIMFPPILIKFINDNMNSYTGMFIFNEYKAWLNFKDASESYDRFTSDIKNSTLGKSISDYITGAKNSQTGSLVKNFSLLTDKDKPFDLEHLKGKYIVLDFWASWCGPCRQSFPHMIEIYNKYKGKDIEFINISIDQNKDSWLGAVSNENLPWTQLLDNKEISLKLFAVTSVPTTYLIDKDGKILMKEIGFNSGNSKIENELKLLFGF